MSILPHVLLFCAIVGSVLGYLLIRHRHKPSHKPFTYEYPMFDEAEFEGDMAGFVQGLNARKDG